MSRRPPFAFRDRISPGPIYGTTQIRIVIEVDEKGLMRTAINKPLPAVQVIGLMLDSMQGQYRMMAEQAKMIIDPNKGIIGENAPETENHNDQRGDPGGEQPLT